MFSIALVACRKSPITAATVAAMYSAVGSNIRKKNYYVPLQNNDEIHHLRKDMPNKFKNSPLYTFSN